MQYKKYTRFRHLDYTIHNTPIYFFVEEYDISIIGVAHSFQKNLVVGIDEKIRRFEGKLHGAEHLILEGTEHANQRQVSAKKVDYAAIAMRNFEGKKYFLEEDMDFGEIASKYGLRKDLLGLYNALRVLERVRVVSQGDAKRFDQLLISVLYDFKTKYPGLSHIDVEESLDRLRKLLKALPNTSLFFGIGEIFAWYSAELREHEILYPKTKELVSRLKGKKAEIVGAYHAGGIEKRLKGVDVESPQEWERFIQGLEQGHRDLVKIIENKIF